MAECPALKQTQSLAGGPHLEFEMWETINLNPLGGWSGSDQ